MIRTESGGYVYTGVTLSTEDLMKMDVKDLEHLKGEVFKQWDRLGAVITLKKAEEEYHVANGAVINKKMDEARNDL